jgi:hypothetical protein
VKEEALVALAAQIHHVAMDAITAAIVVTIYQTNK